MKLERSMKRYYRRSLEGISPPALPEKISDGMRNSSVPTLPTDRLLNLALHCAVIIVVFTGLSQFDRETELSRVMTGHAYERSFETRVIRTMIFLSERMKIIREIKTN